MFTTLFVQMKIYLYKITFSRRSTYSSNESISNCVHTHTITTGIRHLQKNQEKRSTINAPTTFGDVINDRTIARKSGCLWPLAEYRNVISISGDIEVKLVYRAVTPFTRSHS